MAKDELAVFRLMKNLADLADLVDLLDIADLADMCPTMLNSLFSTVWSQYSTSDLEMQ